uniref:Predicted protein n=1 Tax=Hordeum vulgare subsp. vulgare TaxID=112509 RepID=F2DXT3_HORVV|nr:predicted protein [Hordeum vulgare subsp. vulgare]
MKTVDKYQFNEEQGRFDSGIECFLAYHTVIKKYFTLKRIALAEESDQSLYNYLIKEVSILKKVTHENVYRCYKMLKTKNNLYLIYDNIEGETLERMIKEKLSF